MTEVASLLPAEIVEKAEGVLKTATQRGVMLGAAESCTGGLLASLLTDIPECSRAFGRGIVAYSDQAKIDLLGVTRSTLDEHGPVSREAAIAMAQGILSDKETDFAVSITGFAGPGAEGDEEGLVYVAAAARTGTVICEEWHHGAIGRAPIRLASITHGLEMFDRIMV